MGEALMSGGAGGSGTIYKWKRYELNSTTRYTWNKWNLNSTTTYKWNKYDTTSGWTETTSSRTNEFNATTPTKYEFYSGSYIHVGSYNGWYYGTSISATCVRIDASNPTGIVGLYWLPSAGGNQVGPHVRYYISSYIGSGTYVGYHKYNTVQYTLVDGESKGSTSYGQVTSTSSSTYPSNGVQDGYWYESAGSSTSYSRGSYVGTVSSSSSSAYPNGSWSGSYWYDGRSGGTTYSQGAAAGTVYNTNRNAYPDNSYTGSYWYVFDGEA